jgi:putative ABC transport system permease protein
MFIVVANVSTSLNYTLDNLLNELGLDIVFAFENPHHSSRLIDIAESVPGVLEVEIWDQREATINLDTGETRKTYLMSLPPSSQVFNPRIVAGRALLPDDGQANLLNNRIAVEENVFVGDKITLTIIGRDSTWKVVGLIINLGNDQSGLFVPFEALAREIGTVNLGTIVMGTSGGSDLETEKDLISKLEDAYTNAGIKPSTLYSANDVREQSRTAFNIITYLMFSMAFMAAIVGRIGLMGTMSLNVLERGREVSVMRASGTNSYANVGIFISEGVFLDIMSWTLALPLSIPISRSFSKVVGMTLLRLPLDFGLSYNGLLVWLILVLILSTLASNIPALRTTRVSVHETLS